MTQRLLNKAFRTTRLCFYRGEHFDNQNVARRNPSKFNRQFSPLAEPMERRVLLTGELTEGNAAEWGSFATVDHAVTKVSNDATYVKEGTYSIHLRTESGFDTGVSYPKSNNANWDLTNSNFLVFWSYSDNRTPIGFQDNQPIVVLNTSTGKVTLTPQHIQTPNQGWQHYFVPLSGGGDWVRSTQGNPDLKHVTSLEIHQDTWDRGFDIYYDGLQFLKMNPTSGTTSPPGINPDAIKPRVLLYVIDPILENRGNRRTHEVYGWSDPVSLANQVVNDLRTSSHGIVDYQLVDTVIADMHPYYTDGTQGTDESFVANWEANPHIFPPVQFDYLRFIRENNLVERVDSGDIDEVWIYGSPEGAMWESTMAGAGAYWINGPVQNAPSQRAFPIMAFNYERGVAEAIHSFGHRVEGTMDHIYGNQSQNLNNNWNKFTYQDRYSTGQNNGGIGNVHFPVNGTSDYDYNNMTYVMSNADDWVNYPNFLGLKRRVNALEWSPDQTDPQRQYLNWWYSHMPHFSGRGPDGYLNNWWRYIADINQFKAGSQGQLGGTMGVAQVWVRGLDSNSQVSGIVALKAEAVSDGAIGRVDLYVDDQLVGSDTVAPYNFSWNTAGLTIGSQHTITAKVYELQQGSEYVSAPVSVSISSISNRPPVISPISNIEMNEGDSIKVMVKATDPDAGQTLNYFLLGTFPGGMTINSNTGEINWRSINGPASYVITVGAKDNGTPEQSASTSFTVNVRNVAPFIVLAPTADIVLGQQWNQAGNWSDPGMDMWQADVDYGDGSPKENLGLDTNTKTFAFQHMYNRSGNFVVTVSLKDSDGAIATLQKTVRVLPAPAKITKFSTVQNIIQISQIDLTFDSVMNNASVLNPKNYHIIAAGRDGKLGTRDDKTVQIRGVTYNPSKKIATIKTTQAMNTNTMYRLTVSASSSTGVKSADGKLLDGNFDLKAGGNYTKDFGRSFGLSRFKSNSPRMDKI